MTRHWSADYLGLPWSQFGRARDGVDCWGIVALVLKDRCGVSLPSYVSDPGVEEQQEIAAALSGDAEAWPWVEVAKGQERPCDLVTMRLGNFEGHVGIIPWPGAFLHIAKGITSRIERYGSGERWAPMVGRFLRHRGMSECPTG